ncbi:MAG: thioredoxin family protein, partial [Armatimonadetes bacterium]|nr:thioredoxin family protein [Armatimonadota bacterium]
MWRNMRCCIHAAIVAMLFVAVYLAFGDVKWISSVKEALSTSAKLNRTVAAFIYDAGCKWCIENRELMFSPEEVQRLMSQFVCVLLDVNVGDGKALWERHIAKRTDVLPALLFLSSDGELIDFATGYMPKESLTALLSQVMKGITLKEVLKRAQSNVRDVDAAYQAAVALIERDQLELAMPFVDRVMRLTKGKGSYASALNLHLGIRHAYRGQVGLAKKYLSMAASQRDDPSVAEEAQFQLAVVYY